MSVLLPFWAIFQLQNGYGRGHVTTTYGERPGFNRYLIYSDSVPPLKNQSEKPVEKPDVQLPEIKEVPKSRRLIKPMAIPSPLPIKPIKVIKPRIINGLI
ncbi:hypothetical protein [Chitinophaga sp. 212800010-3]|uniref:hypothetical protein n=1 Tax=unclassified Chitinophaga TaxID=2619133 RepID=UPI002E157853